MIKKKLLLAGLLMAIKFCYGQYPAPIINGPSLVCSGTTTDLFVTNSQPGAYTWTVTSQPAGANVAILSFGPTTARIFNWPSFEGVYKFKVTFHGAAGNVSSTDFPVTVKNVSTPAIPSIIGNGTICNVGTTSYNVATQAGLTTLWHLAPGPSIQGTPATITPNGNQAQFNPGTELVNHVLYASYSNGVCSGTQSQKVIQLSNGLGNVTISPAIQSIYCLGSTETYTAYGDPIDAFTWTLPDGSIRIGNSVTLNFNTQGTFNLSVVGNNNCSNTPRSASRTIQVGPARLSAPSTMTTSATTICTRGTVFTVTPVAGATTYYWYFYQGTNQVKGYTSTSNSITAYLPDTQTTAYSGTVSVSNGYCESPESAPFNFTANPSYTNSAISIVNAPIPICLSTSTTFSVTNLPNNTYEWTYDGPATVTGSSTGSNIVISWSAAGQKKVTVKALNQCGGASNTLTFYPYVQESSNTFTSIIGESQPCIGSYYYMTDGGSSVATVSWSVTNEAGAVLNIVSPSTYVTPPSPVLPPNVPVPELPPSPPYYWVVPGATIHWSQAGNYKITVTTTNSCGLNVTKIMNVTVGASAKPSSLNWQSTPVDICLTNTPTSTISVIPIANTTYAWDLGGAGSGVINNNSVNMTWGSPGDYKILVKPVLNDCSGDQIVSYIKVRSTPSVTLSTSTPGFCGGGTTNLSLTGGSALDFVMYQKRYRFNNGSWSEWAEYYGENGNANKDLVSSQGTGITSYEYRVWGFSGLCEVYSNVVTVNVYNNYGITLNANVSSVCANTPITLTLNNSIATIRDWKYYGSGVWTSFSSSTDNSVTFTPVNNGTSDLVYYFQVFTNYGGCYNQSNEVSVIVKPVSTAAATNQTICFGQTTSIPITSNRSGTIFSWTAAATNVTGAVAGSGTSIAQTLTSTDGVSNGYVVYTITPALNGCAGTPINVTTFVSRTAQTITFNSLSSKTLGDPSFTLSATASSALPVTYTSSNPAVATISGSTVTITGPGSTTITANQTGNNCFSPASSVSQTLTVNKKNQTITFSTVTSKFYGDVPYTLNATSNSGLPVSYSSSNTSVATVSGNNITITGAGSATITASQGGDANYNAATSVVKSLTVYKSNQAITFNPLPVKTLGDAPFTLSATSSSGLPVTYTSSNTSVATISGNTVTIVGKGTTTITATQAGNINYNAASNENQSLNVKANQTITFNSIAAKTYGSSTFSLSASASSGLSVSYSSSNTSVATVSGNTVTITGGGTTIITANQSGSSNYFPASPVDQTLTVNKANQTITFNSISTKTYGDSPFTATLNSSGGLPIIYSSSNTSVATISGNTITITGAGVSTITGSQPGNVNYNAASAVSRTLTVNKATQTISFSVPKICIGTSVTLTATASSGLPVTFISSKPTKVSVSGNTMTAIAFDFVDITATQAGNNNYTAVSKVEDYYSPWQLPTSNINPQSSTICSGSSIDLSASSSATSIVWNNGATGNTISVNQPGVYYATLTDYNGCVNSTATATVNVISASITSSGSLCQGTVQLTAGPGTAHLWNTGDWSTTLFVHEPGTYSVSYTSGSCQGLTAQITVPACSFGRVATNASSTMEEGKRKVSEKDAVNDFINKPTSNGFTISPNPVNDELTIQFDESLNQKTQITVYDLLGKIAGSFSINAGEFLGHVHTRELPNGVYMLRFLRGQEMVSSKVVVSH